MPKWDLSIGKLNTRLYTMFPTVEKDVLNEVLAAMRFLFTIPVSIAWTNLPFPTRSCFSFIAL